MTKKIGKYELGRTLGTGNFSKVKVGTDTETALTYAIKIVDKEHLAREHMEEQLKREIAVLKALKHRNIVMMREVLQTTKHIYLVLELVTGGELFDKIQEQKRFEEAVARNFFQQLVMGIRYCHLHGIAHRDLKPENLLLDSAGVLKISDFGLSNLQQGGNTGQATMMQTVCGTPNYVAPEVLKEKGYNGFAADLWSCGVILFVMLAGFLPFDDANINSLFNKIERGEFRMARHFSDGARDLIGKLLVTDPSRRLTIDQVVAHPWFQVDFNPAMLATDIANPSQQDSERAIETAAEPSGPLSPGPASPLRPGFQAGAGDVLAPAAITNPIDDALTMGSRLMAGLFMPLITGSNGMAPGATRRVFLFRGTGKDAHVATKAALDQMRCNPKAKDDPVLEIKGFTNAKKGLLTFIVYVSPSVASNLSAVEIRRGRGDESDFVDFYRTLCANLGGSCVSREIPV